MQISDPFSNFWQSSSRCKIYSWYVEYPRPLNLLKASPCGFTGGKDGKELQHLNCTCSQTSKELLGRDFI